jgi:hypothetical protein
MYGGNKASFSKLYLLHSNENNLNFMVEKLLVKGISFLLKYLEKYLGPA